MPDTPAILEFDEVVIESESGSASTLCNVDFQLHAGDLYLILLDREHLHLTLADAASGLVAPDQGTVRFRGQDWQGLRAGAAAAQRGRIGRLFDEECWVSNLNMEENLMLAQCHHTGEKEETFREEAAALSSQFLLPGLPLGRSSDYRAKDLQKAACVRAFMGKPDLILLERPTHNVYSELMAPLANAVYAARRRGAAVIWTTEQRRVWDDPGLKPTQRVLISNARFHRCNKHDDTISIPAR